MSPPSGDTSCRLQDAACLPVTASTLLGRGPDPSLGAGRRFTGSGDPPELSSSTLRLPLSWADDRWGAVAPHPVVVLQLLASTAGSFRRDRLPQLLSNVRGKLHGGIALKRLILPALA